MADVNFSELLSVQLGNFERPKAFPVGPYDAIISGYDLLTSSKKGIALKASSQAARCCLSKARRMSWNISAPPSP